MHMQMCNIAQMTCPLSYLGSNQACWSAVRLESFTTVFILGVNAVWNYYLGHLKTRCTNTALTLHLKTYTKNMWYRPACYVVTPSYIYLTFLVMGRNYSKKHWLLKNLRRTEVNLFIRPAWSRKIWCLWQGSCAQDLVAYFCALFPLTVCLIPLTVITTYLQHRRCCRHRDSCTGLYNHNKHYHCSATMILMCKLHCISINWCDRLCLMFYFNFK